MNKCINCETETNNSKFCSRSCSATYTNRKFPKRKPEGNCFLCNVQISQSRKYCKQCYKETCIDWSTKTLGDMVKGYGIARYSKIREHSRRVFFKANPKPSCNNCGYNKHVEVCHIKPIKSFNEHSVLTEINSLDNLIGLCPNCHWEHDNLVVLAGIEPATYGI